MPVTFHTSNLNKRLYNNMINNVVLNIGKDVYDFRTFWDIHIWGLCSTNPQFFQHIKTTSGQKINTSMPSGVTGKYRIDLYLHDDNNDFKARENGDRVQHEICHALLYGTKHLVSGVHDNVSNRFTIHFWYRSGIIWKKFQMTVIDIRKFL